MFLTAFPASESPTLTMARDALGSGMSGNIPGIAYRIQNGHQTDLVLPIGSGHRPWAEPSGSPFRFFFCECHGQVLWTIAAPEFGKARVSRKGYSGQAGLGSKNPFPGHPASGQALRRRNRPQDRERWDFLTSWRRQADSNR